LVIDRDERPSFRCECGRLLAQLRGRCSDRKLYLLGCAAYRERWDSLEDEARRVIQLCERHADGLASLGQVTAAANGVIHWDPVVCQREDTWNGYATDVADAFAFAQGAINFVSEEWGFVHGPDTGRGPHRTAEAITVEAARRAAAKATRDAAIAALIRCVLGNPFRVESFDPTELAWTHGTVLGVAEGIFARMDFGALPILADALEETGCANEDVLAHCRLAGRHVRGCWVIDLLLGKA
jgi:hypothetical protein